MKAFRFPLQRVLYVKTLVEKQQRLRFVEAQQQVALAEDKLSQAAAVSAVAVGEGNQASLAADPMLRGLNWRERDRLFGSVQQRAVELKTEQRRLAEQLSLLMEMRRERRSLERLQAKQREHWLKESERQQQALSDDLFSARFERDGRGTGDA